jgi:hypothetical protein
MPISRKTVFDKLAWKRLFSVRRRAGFPGFSLGAGTFRPDNTDGAAL